VLSNAPSQEAREYGLERLAPAGGFKLTAHKKVVVALGQNDQLWRGCAVRIRDGRLNNTDRAKIFIGFFPLVLA
jgi:hypothetical protein